MCVSRRIERDASASAARFFFKVMRSVFATIVTDHAIVAVRVIEVVFVRVVYRVHAFEHVPGTTPDSTVGDGATSASPRSVRANSVFQSQTHAHPLDARLGFLPRAPNARATPEPTRPHHPRRAFATRLRDLIRDSTSPAPTTKHLRIMFT
jgi:hypothetical protein